ncbi:MAG: THUMP domain-containing protein [Nanoarchaeota archaeon]
MAKDKKRVTSKRPKVKSKAKSRTVMKKAHTKISIKMPVMKGNVTSSNLLVTFDPAHSGRAVLEIQSLLKEVKMNAEFVAQEEGLFLLKASNPKEIVKKLKVLCEKSPKKFNSTFHYIPIDTWASSNIKTMQTITKKLGEKIGKTEKWKMNLNKRHYEVDSRELIVKLTDPIDRQFVDLKNPDKIVQVEIIGKNAGISLLSKNELLEVSKIKG